MTFLSRWSDRWWWLSNLCFCFYRFLVFCVVSLFCYLFRRVFLWSRWWSTWRWWSYFCRFLLCLNCRLFLFSFINFLHISSGCGTFGGGGGGNSTSIASDCVSSGGGGGGGLILSSSSSILSNGGGGGTFVAYFGLGGALYVGIGVLPKLFGGVGGASFIGICD